MPINIFVLDNKMLVREGLKCILQYECDATVVGLSDFDNVKISDIKASDANIVILDIDDVGALNLLREIVNKKVNVKIVLLVGEINGEQFHSAIGLKCDGVITKDATMTEMKNAIFSVYSGETYFDPKITKSVMELIAQRNDVKSKIEELTDRELDVLKLVSVGYLNKEIADQLNISERTVKNHISSIFKKISVNDRTMAAVFAIKNKLVEL